MPGSNGGGARLQRTAAPAGAYVLVSDAFRLGRHDRIAPAVIGGVGTYADARGAAQFTAVEREPNGKETNEIVIRPARSPRTERPQATSGGGCSEHQCWSAECQVCGVQRVYGLHDVWVAADGAAAPVDRFAAQ